jgi:hypothetical protein
MSGHRRVQRLGVGQVAGQQQHDPGEQWQRAFQWSLPLDAFLIFPSMLSMRRSVRQEE